MFLFGFFGGDDAESRIAAAERRRAEEARRIAEEANIQAGIEERGFFRDVTSGAISGTLRAVDNTLELADELPP